MPSRHTDTGKLESSPGHKLGSPGMNFALPHPVIGFWPQKLLAEIGTAAMSARKAVLPAGVLWLAQLGMSSQGLACEGLQVEYSSKHLLFGFKRSLGDFVMDLWCQDIKRM